MHIPGFVMAAKNAVRKFLSQRQNLTLLMVVGGAFLVIAAVVLAFFLRPAHLPSPLAPATPPQEAVARDPLTGEIVLVPGATLPQVFGVMVENSADAWPLSGLDQAFMVIEAPAEGNIPRFIAFFSGDFEDKKIGPVRSARPYYVDWASQFDTLVYAHVGGSPEGLALLTGGERPVINLDEFYQGEYFYRDQARYAPHNAYTTSDRLKKALEEVTPATPNYQPLIFKDDAPVGDSTGKSAVVDWGPGKTYDVAWQYDSATNAYLRLQGGQLLSAEKFKIPADGIEANNVMIISTDIVSIDNVDRKRITTVGQGDALLFQDGKVTLGRWQKNSPTDRLRMLDEQGNELPMNAGKTWVEVVRDTSVVSLQDAN